MSMDVTLSAMPFYDLWVDVELDIPKSETDLKSDTDFVVTAASWRGHRLCFHDAGVRRQKGSVESEFWWDDLLSKWEEGDASWCVRLTGPLWIVPLNEPVRSV